jgi:hypothetical protein
MMNIEYIEIYKTALKVNKYNILKMIEFTEMEAKIYSLAKSDYENGITEDDLTDEEINQKILDLM